MPIQAIAGGVSAFSSASGGKVRPFNAITNIALTQVLPPNPSRVTATFHNPGANDIFVAPAVDATGAVLAPSNAALGGTFRVFANGGTLIISGECQTAWNAFGAAGITNPFTSMESNV